MGYRDLAAVGHPVQPRERIFALDVFRGFAMFGVVVAYCVWNLGNRPAETWSPLDDAAAAFVAFAIDGKFYTILAFLFGLGFQLQLSRAGDARDEAVRLYRRRLVALAAIGLTHALLLRNGDILLPYAVTGFFLVPFRRASNRTLPWAAFLILLIPVAVRLAWQASGWPMPDRPGAVDDGYLAENFAWVRFWYATAILIWPAHLTLFLFGLLAGRIGAVARLIGSRTMAAAIFVGGMAFATVLHLLSTALAENASDGSIVIQAGARLLFTLHTWALAAAYMAVLLLLLGTVTGVRALAPLAAIGRMALTNYLMQAALIVPFCLAFGLFDRFTPGWGLLLGIVVFAAIQIPFSMFWLRRFEFGPAEWLWRVLTYGGALPIRARQAVRPL